MEVAVFIILGILSRVIPHPANMTAVGAMALFSGSKLGLWKGTGVIVVTMVLTDMIYGFHSVMWATYGSLIITLFLGRFLRKDNDIVRLIGFSFVSSLIFYLVTNFAVWAVPGSVYPKTPAGLMESYILALPFFRNSLIGDFVYASIFFYGYEFVWMINTRVRKMYAHS